MNGRNIFLVIVLLFTCPKSLYGDSLYAEAIYGCPCIATQTCTECNCNNARCRLSYDNSYVKPASKTYTDSLWNMAAFEFTDMAEIIEHMRQNSLKEITIKGTHYFLDAMIADGYARIAKLRPILLNKQYDQVRGKYMRGLPYILGANFAACPPMVGLRYYYAFHTASLVEGMLKFLQVAGDYNPNITRATVADLDLVLKDFWYTWREMGAGPLHGGAYEDISETQYVACVAGSSPPRWVAYNMASSIGIAYLRMAELGGGPEYRDRADKLAKFVVDAIYEYPAPGDGEWYYSQARDRYEDPDHAAEVLRFMEIARDKGLLRTNILENYLNFWLTEGINGNYLDDSLQKGHSGVGPLITDVQNRMVGIFKHKKEEYWQTFVPVWTGGGTMTVSIANLTFAKYKDEKGEVTFTLGAYNGTLGGVAHSDIFFTLPVGINTDSGGGSAWCGDPAPGVRQVCMWTAYTNNRILVRKADHSSWNLGATFEIQISGKAGKK